jgi:transposase
MSLQAQEPSLIPEETAHLARTISPTGTLYMQIRDQLGQIYEDQSFADLFSHCGQPAEIPWRLALVCVFQFIEDLTDRQAAEAVRQRIDWKYALGLQLTDLGFHFSVLSKFRARLLAGKAEIRLFERLLEQLKTQGLMKVRGCQRTDSTHVLAAVRVLNRLERVGETLRHALNSVAEIAPDWLCAQTPPQWYDRYSSRMENYHFPKEEAARQALGATMGEDGFTFLGAIEAAIDLPWLGKAPAVEILRQVWAEQYTTPPGPILFREKKDLDSSADLIVSPYDTEARFSIKRGMEWIGYKVHFTETCDEEYPHLITHVETTHAAVPDEQVLPSIHEALAHQDLLPEMHVVDAGYTDAAGLVGSQRDYAVTLLGPVAADASWQTKAGKGFNKESFVVDWQAQTVTCPAGKQSLSWLPCTESAKLAAIHVRFSRKDCSPCPLRSQCTRAKIEPRELMLQSQEQYEALHTMRQRQTTAEFREHYAIRAGVEATHAQGLQRSGLRQTRYIGQAKTHLQHILTAIALNLVRLVAWVAQASPTKPRISRFAALKLHAA